MLAFYELEFVIFVICIWTYLQLLEGHLLNRLSSSALCCLFLPLFLKSFLSQENKLGPGFQHGDLKQPSYFLQIFNPFSCQDLMGETKNRSNMPMLLSLTGPDVWQTFPGNIKLLKLHSGRCLTS